MRVRTTIFLFLLVAALGAVILGVERFLPSTRERIEMKRGPVRFDPKQVTQIDIDSSGGDGLTLAWDGQQWWVRRPFNDLADPEKVAQLMQSITSIGWIERVHRKEFDESGWARTALDQPRYKLRAIAGSQPLMDCWIGGPSPIEGSHYLSLRPLQPGTEAAHYVAKTGLPDVLKASPKAWRDAKLVRVPANLVMGLQLTQAGGGIEMARPDEKAGWMLVKPLSTRGSKERINELLSTLLNLEVTDATEPANGNKSNEASSAIAEAVSDELKVGVLIKGSVAPRFEITLKKPAKDQLATIATVGHRKPVFNITAKGIADLWAEPNDLRDKNLARIDEDAVTAIEITSTAFPPVMLSKQGDSWFLQRHGKAEAANGERISRFFHAMNTHVILAFTADSASNLALYGLDAPIQTVSWVLGGAKPVKLLIGKNAESTEFFAKYEDEPSVYRIDASLLPAIPPDPIKWKGLGALRFSQFALRRVTLAAGTAPPVMLNYDPTTAQWSGERAGRDITNMIDRVRADKLAGALAKLNVHDWVADRSEALQALKTPALRVEVTLGEPGTNQGPVRVIPLNFAPTQPGMDTAFYFGQLGEGPDVFYVTRPALLELLAPVFKVE